MSTLKVQLIKMEEKIILVTNDDGIHSHGLEVLSNIMRQFGKVVVVAPEEPMSGMSHAVTVKHPLRIKTVSREDGIEKYSCNGTPVDSVKLGEQVVLRRKPTLLVSGINHGSNAAVNIVYSGTMAAVLEGTISGIPSIGFSLTTYAPDADFSGSIKYIEIITSKVLQIGLPQGVCLNVNIPAVKPGAIKGIKICKQGKGAWMEEFDERKDPRNRDYYWLTGSFKTFDNGVGTDEWALANNYISVVPVHYDLTAHHAIEEIHNWDMHVE